MPLLSEVASSWKKHSGRTNDDPWRIGRSHRATEKKEMKMIFSRIVLHYDKVQSMVREVELYEKNGDNTTITLTHVRKNEPIDEKIYDVE